MSFEIPVWLIEEYRSTVYTLMQQKGSKLGGLVTRDTLGGRTGYYDRIGPTEAEEITARHQETPQIDSQHSRVQLSSRMWAWADYIDDVDRAQMLAEPEGHYVRAAVMAMGRRMDRTIIGAFNAPMRVGMTGETTVNFPGSQVVDANGSSGTNLSVDKLKEAMLKLRQADADPDMDDVICVLSAEAWDSLLGDPHFINADFSGSHPLYGPLTSHGVQGMRFVQTQLLPKAGNIRQCFVYLRRSMILAENLPLFVRVQEDMNRNYSTQVYVRWAGGSARLEDTAVVQVDVDESATFDGS